MAPPTLVFTAACDEVWVAKYHYSVTLLLSFIKTNKVVGLFNPKTDIQTKLV